MNLSRFKKISFVVIGVISSLSTLIFGSFFSSSFSKSQYNATSKGYVQELKQKNINEIYSNARIKVDETSDVVSNIYRTTYTNNFKSESLEILTFSDGLNRPIKCSSSFDGNIINFPITPVSSYAYSNDFEKMTFETININLYKKRTREEEITIDRQIFDGFIYLPDFVADSLIEKDSYLKSYDDLIMNKQDVPFTLNFGAKTYNFKIANVFRVNDFKEEYSKNTVQYSDNNNGEKLFNYLGAFCFIPISQRFEKDNNLSLTLINILKTKSTLLNEYINLIKAKAFSGGSVSITFHLGYLNNGVLEVNDFTNSFFGAEPEFGWPIYLFIVSAVILIVFIFQSLSKKYSYSNCVGRCLCTTASSVAFMLFAYFFKTFDPNFDTFLFFNTYSLALSAALIIFSFFILLFKRVGTYANKN